MIEYSLKPISPEAHLIEVRLRINAPDPDGQRVYLPAWIRGSYMVRDFARNIVSISAKSAERDVDHRKLDKQTWLFDPVSGERNNFV